MEQPSNDPIEVDEVEVEDEALGPSGYGDATDTESLTSSVQEYLFENGRRYHAYFGTDKNLMPTDEKEQDRMDMHHEIMLMQLEGALYKAPLSNPQRILDVGTGTGIWAIDMADKFPMAEVFGTDLSPIQPRWVPPNCQFQVEDAEHDWSYKSDFFDFVHLRNLVQCISDWPRLMKQVYRATAPGGYAELVETTPPLYCDDGSLKPDNASKIYCDHLVKSLDLIGRPVATLPAMVKYLKDAGFVDVRVLKRKQPVGIWPKDPLLKKIGVMCLLNCETGYEAYGMAFLTRILKMDTDVALKLCRDALEGVRDRNVHTYGCMYVVYGRKPEE